MIRARVVFLILLFACGLVGCQENLYTNLSEREANEMAAALIRSGIPADRIVQSDGKMTVAVDGERLAEAVQTLDRAGLPKPEFASMGTVFANEGIVASPMQERAKMVYALSEELSRTISEIDGVLSARVHVVLPESNPLRRDDVASSASVFVRYEAGLAIAPLIPQIKTLVANGIAGLAYDKVSVVPVASAAAATGASEPPLDLVSVGGVWMLGSSATRALAVVGGLATLALGLAVALCVVLVRQRRNRVYALVPAK